MKDYNAPINKIIIDNINNDAKVLDIGCSTGLLGRYLINKKNCSIYGIDWNDNELSEAKKNGYQSTNRLDLNSDDLHDFFDSYLTTNGKFDVIVLGDILEHLIDPYNLLINIKNLINKDGIVLCSIPNIAFLYYRIQLLLGNWNYRKYGVMDETHLRFYTKKTIVELFNKSGLKIIKIQTNNQFYPLNYLNIFARILPGVFSYQFFLIAK